MKTLTFVTFIILIDSCLPANRQRDCSYTLHELEKNWDSTKLMRIDYQDYGLTEVFDKPNLFGERGYYKFDENNTLRLYAFLRDSTNGYTFSIEYDSLGHEYKTTGTEVVHWYFRKLTGDSLAITFYVCSINRRYENVVLTYGSSNVSNLELLKHNYFSNLYGKQQI